MVFFIYIKRLLSNGTWQQLIDNFKVLIQQSVEQGEDEVGTYSRGVDAQFSGQDEKSSSQDVNVHLRRRANHKKKKKNDV